MRDFEIILSYVSGLNILCQEVTESPAQFLFTEHWTLPVVICTRLINVLRD